LGSNSKLRKTIPPPPMNSFSFSLYYKRDQIIGKTFIFDTDKAEWSVFTEIPTNFGFGSSISSTNDVTGFVFVEII
jgi:hypothetical protein